MTLSTPPRYIGIAGRKGSGKSTLAQRLMAAHGMVDLAMADELKRRARTLFGLPDDSLWGDSTRRESALAVARVPGGWAGALARWRDSRFWEDLFLPAEELYAAGVLKTRPDGLDHAARAIQATACLRLILRGAPNAGGNPTTRWALQVLGTEYGRALWEDVWVEQWRRDGAAILAGWQYTPEGGPVGEKIAGTPPCAVIGSDIRFANEVRAIQRMPGVVLALDADARIGVRTDAHSSEDDGPVRALATVIRSDSGPAHTYREACLHLGLREALT